MANRHLSRTVAMQTLYEWDFNGSRGNLDEILARSIENFAPGIDDPKFINDLVSGVRDHKAEITEAVELGKPFGGGSSGKFVNGFLGSVYGQMTPEEATKQASQSK